MLHAAVGIAASLSLHAATLAAVIIAPGLLIDRVLPGVLGRFLWATGIVVLLAHTPHHVDTLVFGLVLTLLLAGLRWIRSRPPTARRALAGRPIATTRLDPPRSGAARR